MIGAVRNLDPIPRGLRPAEDILKILKQYYVRNLDPIPRGLRLIAVNIFAQFHFLSEKP